MVPMNKKKILLIEDESNNEQMIRLRLEASGFCVLQEKEGAQGVKTAQEEKPDLILMDLVLSDMHGLEVCRQLQSDESCRNIPVIIMTTSGREDVLERCLACGAKDLVRKPYDSKALVDKIKALLGA